MVEFLDTIPEEVKVKKELNLPRRMGEHRALSLIEEKLKKNKVLEPAKVFNPDPPFFSYLPAAIDYISSSSELVTSYTPYQAEVSQGLLQILFEYQSMICDLTGMDVANASLYDHSTALCEAIRMALRYTDRNKVLMPKYMRKKRREVVETYFKDLGVEIVDYSITKDEGKADLAEIEAKIRNAACIYVECPTYFGVIDDSVDEISSIAKRAGALFIVGTDPISLAIIKEPGSYGADIVVGEAQHLALHPCYGGPSLGMIACREDLKLIHLMPGRIVGCTTTLDGSELGFALVLQAREQHIRREKATSNITTNQSLLAVRAAMFLALYGKEGLKRLAARILINTRRLSELLKELGFISPLFKATHFRNFLAYCHGAAHIKAKMLKKGFFLGKEIDKDFNEFKDSLLLGVNEYHDERSFEELKESLKEVLENV